MGETEEEKAEGGRRKEEDLQLYFSIRAILILTLVGVTGTYIVLFALYVLGIISWG